MSARNGRASGLVQRRADTGEVVALAVARARPDGRRPRISAESEAVLEPVERATAQCYAECELLTHRLHKLAESIENGDDAVPLVDLDDSDSALYHIHELRRKTES